MEEIDLTGRLAEQEGGGVAEEAAEEGGKAVVNHRPGGKIAGDHKWERETPRWIDSYVPKTAAIFLIRTDLRFFG
ncbi:MAG TPA: hypothetical protein VG733_03200 [Chthoniobacteraceae bacterium]|nr:hypothetical protein [Chthoniobacteraceae bacterium]